MKPPPPFRRSTADEPCAEKTLAGKRDTAEFFFVFSCRQELVDRSVRGRTTTCELRGRGEGQAS